jgi:hypothetical protein
VDKHQPLGTIMDRWAKARATATALEDTPTLGVLVSTHTYNMHNYMDVLGLPDRKAIATCAAVVNPAMLTWLHRRRRRFGLAVSTSVDQESAFRTGEKGYPVGGYKAAD